MKGFPAHHTFALGRFGWVGRSMIPQAVYPGSTVPSLPFPGRRPINFQVVDEHNARRGAYFL